MGLAVLSPALPYPLTTAPRPLPPVQSPPGLSGCVCTHGVGLSQPRRRGPGVHGVAQAGPKPVAGSCLPLGPGTGSSRVPAPGPAPERWLRADLADS